MANAKQSVLTITKNSEIYNDILKCVVTWEDSNMSIETETDINAIGARIAEYTFDTGQGEAILSCIVWGDEAPLEVTWTNEDGDVNTQQDKVLVLPKMILL